MLEIKDSKNGTTQTITIAGRLDTQTAPELEGFLKTALDGVEHLVFDISGLQYVSSAGLRVILAAQKSMSKKGDMVVKHPTESVSEIFEVTGFSDILTVEK